MTVQLSKCHIVWDNNKRPHFQKVFRDISHHTYLIGKRSRSENRGCVSMTSMLTTSFSAAPAIPIIPIHTHIHTRTRTAHKQHRTLYFCQDNLFICYPKRITTTDLDPSRRELLSEVLFQVVWVQAQSPQYDPFQWVGQICCADGWCATVHPSAHPCESVHSRAHMPCECRMRPATQDSVRPSMRH